MASQTNNFILLEKDISSPLRGQQRSIDAADDIILSPATVTVSPTGNVAINSTSGSLNVGNVASTAAINIGTNGARVITLGQGITTGPTIILNGATNTTTIESVGILAIGSNYANNETINLGSASLGALAFVRTVNIGNTASGSTTNIWGGSGISITGATAVVGAFSATSSSQAISLDATTSGTISIGSAGGTGAISIGTAATNRTITLGNATNTSVLTLNAGSGGIAITTNATAGVINLGADNGTGTISIGSGTATRAINMGTGAAAGTISIGTAGNRTINFGNATNTSAISIIGGSGAINIGNDASSTGTINIAGSTATGARTINIGTGATGAKTVTIGDSTVAGSTINLLAGTAGGVNIAAAATNTPVFIATNSTAGTVSIGTGSATHTLAFGTGLGVKTVQVGSTSSTSSTTVQAGTGAMTFTAGGIYDVNATGAVTIDSSGGAIGIGSDNVNQSINLGSAGNRFITIGALNNTNSVNLNAGRRGVDIRPSQTYGSRGIGIQGTNRTASTYTNGALLAFQVSPAADANDPQMVLASAASGALASVKQVNGVSSAGFSVTVGTTSFMCTVAGTITPVQFASGAAPAGSADIGKPVYLSATVGQEGKATLTAPSASGQRIFQVGILARGVADADSNWYVQLMPQFIADIP